MEHYVDIAKNEDTSEVRVLVWDEYQKAWVEVFICNSMEEVMDYIWGDHRGDPV